MNYSCNTPLWAVVTHMASSPLRSLEGPLQLSVACARGLEPLTIGARTSSFISRLDPHATCGRARHGAARSTYLYLPLLYLPHKMISARAVRPLRNASLVFMPSSCRAHAELAARRKPESELSRRRKKTLISRDRVRRCVRCARAGEEASVWCWLPRRGGA